MDGPPAAPRRDVLAIMVVAAVLSLLVLAAVTFERPTLTSRFNFGFGDNAECKSTGNGDAPCVNAD